ncbi:MAG: hypothetical protein RMZ43_008315 [Nostoc sp. CmiVER01]|uniref:hypothetical protein n=1 Tax=Nostoc sp. CmiVER01 TaxID=3075384 RepID=UPI002AD3C069|nr:hypothetical protein [Nostoc sp. CmiVER01]MDZ8122914.1 hypothetical protein [Nostoc sp. CmiVER01]
MAFDLDEKFQLDIAQMNLKKVHTVIFSLHNPKIPFVIWLLENPNSPLALPGKISLRHHDYIHILLGRGLSPQDEAFVIGFTMGNDLKTNQLHLFIYKTFAKFIYPYPYKFSSLDLINFNFGFIYGRKIKIKQINEINFEFYQDEPIKDLRNIFGINPYDIKLIGED